MSECLISIIMPTYNSEKTIEKSNHGSLQKFRTLQILIQMSCKEYLEQYNLRVEQSKARGRFLVTGQAIPAGIPF